MDSVAPPADWQPVAPSWSASAPAPAEVAGEFETPIARLSGGVPAPQVNQPLSAADSVAAAVEGEPVAPLPWSANAPTAAGMSVQTPPPAPPVSRVGTPVAQLPRSKPAPAASRPPAVVRPLQSPAATKSPSRVIYVVLGLVLLAVIGGGIWYFTRPKPGPSPNVTGPMPDTSHPTSGPQTPVTADRLISIPAATFAMGRDNASDPEETPAHPASVAAFDMDRRPVTNARYAEFVKTTGHAAPGGWVNGAPPDGQSEWPATGVSWVDANAYCTSRGLRLPTEAEWEYAARGADGRLYPWGNSFSPALTNSAEAALNHPEEVGAHRDATSPFGLLDMSGNVWEWTADNYQPYPGHRPAFDIPADAKAIRGGSYKSDKLHVTTTTRNLDHASSRSATIGFRCAK